MLQSALKHVRTTLTMTMTVKSENVTGEPVGQFVCTDAEARSRRTRIVEQCTHLTVFWIDTQPQRALPCPTVVSLILRKRVECQMAGAANYFVNFVIFVGR